MSAMDSIEGRFQRIGKAVAHPGKGDELERLLREAADGAASAEGCELYLVARDPADPEAVWITEIWSDPEAPAAALAAPGVPEKIEQVKELVAEWGEQHNLVPAGGLDVDGAAPTAPTGHTILNLEEVKDLAPDFGYAEFGEARFANQQLGTGQTGFAFHRLKPGKRQAFGHHHDKAEEVYVVIGGSGRIALDDEVRDIGLRDAVRIGPEVARAIEAGPEGLELLAFGPRHEGDGELLMGWWPGQD